MNSARKLILRRAAKGAAAIALPALIAALTSKGFRDFVGDDTLTVILVGAAVPALLAAEKALGLRKSA